MTARRLHDETFRLVPPRDTLDGPRFWAELPFRVWRELESFRPDAVLVQSPYEAAAALVARRARAGDPRDPRRLADGDPALRLRRQASCSRPLRTGSRSRRFGASTPCGRSRATPPASSGRPESSRPRPSRRSWISMRSWGPPSRSRGDRERCSSECWSDTRTSTGSRPPGGSPRPGCRTTVTLRIVGKGSRADVVSALVRDLPGRTGWVAEVSNDQIRGMLDDATALVLPSRSEGLGRIVVEALCRGRPVVATRVGGITDLVRDGENGLLVEPRSPAALADALVHVLVRRRARRAPRRSRAAERRVLDRDTRGLRAPDARPRRAGARDEPPACPLCRAHPVHAAARRPAWNGSGRRSSSSSRSVSSRRLATGCHKADARFELVGGSFYGALPVLRPAGGPRLSAAGDRGRGSTYCDPRDRGPARGAGDRRGARQLAALDTSVRLACASRALAARRSARRVRREACRRRPRPLRLHRGARRGVARPTAGRRLPHLQRPLGVHGLAGRAAPGAAGGALRRRARAVQERRRADRGLAARVAAGPAGAR